MAKKIVQPPTQQELEQLQKERLEMADIHFSAQGLKDYYSWPDVIEGATTETLEVGYKICGSCRKAKKFYLFNKNSGAKNGCSGSCKECQKEKAKKSYKKTKQKRNYARYYQENKEVKQAAAKKWYAANKEQADLMHKKYVQSKRGKKVMLKARQKRNEALETRKGIPYTRELLIQRDLGQDGIRDEVVCYLCGQPVDLVDGKATHIDHIIGINIGGMNCFTNVALVHSTCNLKKTKTCEEVTPAMTKKFEERSVLFVEAHPELFE